MAGLSGFSRRAILPFSFFGNLRIFVEFGHVGFGLRVFGFGLWWGVWTFEFKSFEPHTPC